MTVATRPGRPREFDHDAVLDAAVDLFWRQGYGDTSMRELEAALGITQSSIYNAFGSKRDLLTAAMDRYETRIEAEVLSPIRATGGLAAALQFLDALLVWITADGRRGCMIINLMAGESGDDALAERTAAFRAGLRDELTAVLADEPDMDATVAAEHAELILTASLGLNVAARGGADADELAGMVAATKAQVRRWADG